MVLAIGRGVAPGALGRFLEEIKEPSSVSPTSNERFFSSASPEPVGIDLSKKNVTIFSNLWRQPDNLVMGGIYAFSCISALRAFVHGGLALCSQAKNLPGAGADRADHQRNLLKRWVFDSLSLVGQAASMGDWADKQKIVRLGGGALYCKLIGSLAWCTTSGIQAYGYYNEVVQQWKQFEMVKEDKERAQLEQESLLSCLNLVGYSTTVLWALFTFISVVPGFEIAEVWAQGSFYISGLFTVGSVVYKIILDNRQKLASAVGAVQPKV